MSIKNPTPSQSIITRNPIAEIEVDADLQKDIDGIIGSLIAIAETNCDGRYLQISQDGTERRPLDYQVTSMLSAMLSKCHRQENEHAPKRDTMLRNQWEKLKSLASSSNEIDAQSVASLRASKNAFDLECAFVSAVKTAAGKGYTYLSGRDWEPWVAPATVKRPLANAGEAKQKEVTEVIDDMDAMFK